MPTNNKLSIPISRPDLSDKERGYLLEAFDSTWVSSQGSFVERFERRFAEFVGVSEGVSCVNGTAALHLALLALGVGPGREVIVPDLTYVATANAVRYVGATPVFADCDPNTWTLDPASVERLLSERTQAVMAVHLFGMPADLAPLAALAKRHGLALIEDASQAHGATYDGEPVGSWGTLSTFSFYGNKVLTTGEGGMVCTDDPKLAKRIRTLRGQGVDPSRDYWFDEVGYNYRMTNLACAIGLAQLERFDQLRAKREQVRAAYEDRIKRSALPVRLQGTTPYARPVTWMLGAVFEENVPRDSIRRVLAAAGIETRPFFPPMHTLPMYSDARTDDSCPVSTTLGRQGVMLPTHTKLLDADIKLIVESIGAALLQPA